MAQRDLHGALYDEHGREVVVGHKMLRRFVKAPQGLVHCADRYELWDGSVVWSWGFRGWYDEHALQGGLRTIEYHDNPLRTVE